MPQSISQIPQILLTPTDIIYTPVTTGVGPQALWQLLGGIQPLGQKVGYTYYPC